jgi:hypothetical protein
MGSAYEVSPVLPAYSGKEPPEARDDPRLVRNERSGGSLPGADGSPRGASAGPAPPHGEVDQGDDRDDDADDKQIPETVDNCADDAEDDGSEDQGKEKRQCLSPPRSGKRVQRRASCLSPAVPGR